MPCQQRVHEAFVLLAVERAVDVIVGPVERPRLCLNSNLCVPPQMLGMKGICYNPAVKKLRV